MHFPQVPSQEIEVVLRSPSGGAIRELIPLNYPCCSHHDATPDREVVIYSMCTEYVVGVVVGVGKGVGLGVGESLSVGCGCG